MTESEAIKEFEQNIQLPFGSSISDEASKLAIKALEKQIPKKPVLLDRPFAGVKVPVCPTCSTPEHYRPLYSRVRYCHDCGQKLDWSDKQ